MAVPSNPKLSDIQTEFGGSNPIGLSEYYSGGPLVPAASPAPNGPIPSSGQISMGQFRGAVKQTFIDASGGTESISGDYKIHTFTGPGTFTVNATATSPADNVVDYLVVAGGAGSGFGQTGDGGGGGGAGGFRESVPSPAAWTASPLANPGNARPVTATGYPITVGNGGGGAGGGSAGGDGNNSTFSDITSEGGGGGGGSRSPSAGRSGGSGGGAGGHYGPGSGGSGNSPPVSPPQGRPGGPHPGDAGGGGGGATQPGPSTSGGNGATTSISASPVEYSEGGNGGSGPTSNGPANSGDGGGTDFTGSASGGSGIVILRYKYQ
jgi:hypothetical protein